MIFRVYTSSVSYATRRVQCLHNHLTIAKKLNTRISRDHTTLLQLLTPRFQRISKCVYSVYTVCIQCSYNPLTPQYQLQRSCYHSVHTIIAQLIYIHLHHEIQPSCNYKRTIGILLINFLAISRTLADTRSSDSYNRLATSRTLLTP